MGKWFPRHRICHVAPYYYIMSRGAKTTTGSEVVRGNRLFPILYVLPIVNLRSSLPPSSHWIIPAVIHRPSFIHSHLLPIALLDPISFVHPSYLTGDTHSQTLVHLPYGFGVFGLSCVHEGESK